MLHVTQTPGTCTILQDHHWKLLWTQKTDRWEHSLWRGRFALESESEKVVWDPAVRSIDGLPADNWPPSPPWQDLFVEQKSLHQCEIQLLGQAAGNHYSGAIMWNELAREIHFDLAVRLQTAPPERWIVSQYQRAIPDGECSLITHRLQDHPITTSYLESSTCSTSEPFATIAVDETTSLKWDRKRCTFRWAYSLRLPGGP